MALGLLGKKLGMTQIFSGEGLAIPVTAVEVGPCTVTQIKTKETDGYTAVQLGYGETLPKRLTKPQRGHLQKAGLETMVKHLKEFRVEKPEEYQIGQTLSVDLFQVDQLVDISGISIGRGFAGNQKRNHFGRGPMSHGSKNHRLPGSIGAGTTPGRVFPGLRMPGQLGGKRITTRKLQIVQVYPEKNVLLIKGTVPGVEGSVIEIKPTNRVGKPKQKA